MRFTNNQEQLKSSDPSLSVWVSASAGTGKTKVLTDRVLKLLLLGHMPSKILCLTFTKAAAGEMLERINNELKLWSRCSKEELHDALYSLLGRAPTISELSTAKNIFYILLNSSEQLQIQTIHGFCQSLLRLFPFEASIAPGFEVIDEIKSQDLIIKASHNIFKDIYNAETDEALSFLEKTVHDMSLQSIQNEIIEHRIKFKFLINHFQNHQNYESFLKNAMDLNRSFEEYFEVFLSDIDKLGHSYIFTKAEYEKYSFLDEYRNYLSLPTHKKQQNFRKIKGVFFTKSDSPRKKLISSKHAKENQSLSEFINKAQECISRLDQIQKSFVLVRDSKFLFILALRLITSYDDYKNKLGYLDYDDLIYFANRLLNSSSAKEWVLYKLDGGIEHVLIDEAQDTSPAQWEIISALMHEFYSGNEDSIGRTIFVVGDEKQSIYSFQGADLKAFQGMKEFLYNQMKLSYRPYQIIDLASSYRSAPAIVKFIEKCFSRLSNLVEYDFPSYNNLNCFRNSSKGTVEIWPLLDIEEEEDLFWPIFPSTARESPGWKLGQNIASYITELLESKTILPSTGKVVKKQDIMILIRKRDTNALDMIKALQKNSISISGIDRVTLSESLESQDIISIAKFVLQPFDNLNLSSLLKSPFFGLSDDEIRDIIMHDKKNFLWENLKSMMIWQDIYSVLDQFYEIYLAYPMQDFFYIILNNLGYRQKLLSYGGEESADIIDEFLTLSRSFSRSVSSNLQEFVIWFQKSNTEIKRIVEKTDKIRIMTIHGAKGLQAPIVIIADNGALPRAMGDIVWTKDNIALWSSSVSNHNYLDSHKGYNHKLEYEEYLRLLYVAMTRAEDKLIMASYNSTTSSNSGYDSWYKIMQDTMAQMDFASKEYSFLSSPFVIYQDDSEDLLIDKTILEQDSSDILLPVIPELNPIIRKFTMTDSFNPTLDSSSAMEFGTIFHKVMEDTIRNMDFSIPKTHPMLNLLTIAQRDFIASKIDQILNLEEFKALFELKIKTEVNIGVDDNGKTRIGRIDIMAVGDGRVIILDYKTGYDNLDISIKEKYLDQLSFYVNAIGKIYNGYKIEAKILWVDSLRFQTVYCKNISSKL